MLVSIYIPTKNRRKLLERAVDSVLSQTYKNIELIIVDDASTDDTQEYLGLLKNNKRVTVITMPTSMGACVARNIAISQAEGGFLTGLDDDDYFTIERVEKFVAYWQKTKTKIAGIFDAKTKLLSTGDTFILTPPKDIVTIEDILGQNMIGSQVFAPKSHYIQSGFFDLKMPAWQDWELWIRMAHKFGEFHAVEGSSYVVDESHQFTRISEQPEFIIRHAMNMILHKNPNLSKKQKAMFLSSCLFNYSSVHLAFSDILDLLMHTSLRHTFNIIYKKIIS